MRIVTTDPVSGLAGYLFERVGYVVSGVQSLYVKYGTGTTDWALVGLVVVGVRTVTATDPRSVGLAAGIGKIVLYVTGHVGLYLRKFGTADTDWTAFVDTGAGSALELAASASEQRTVLGLGTAATASASSFAAAVHTHAAADIVSGTVDTARLGSGTANSSTYLRGDQTWAAAGGGGGSWTAATLALGSDPKTEHYITVTDAAISPSSKVIVTWGACLDTDENGPDMDAVTFCARPGSGSAVVVVASERPVLGALKVLYQVV